MGAAVAAALAAALDARLVVGEGILLGVVGVVEGILGVDTLLGVLVADVDGRPGMMVKGGRGRGRGRQMGSHGRLRLATWDSSQRRLQGRGGGAGRREAAHDIGRAETCAQERHAGGYILRAVSRPWRRAWAWLPRPRCIPRAGRGAGRGAGQTGPGLAAPITGRRGRPRWTLAEGVRRPSRRKARQQSLVALAMGTFGFWRRPRPWQRGSWPCDAPLPVCLRCEAAPSTNGAGLRWCPDSPPAPWHIPSLDWDMLCLGHGCTGRLDMLCLGDLTRCV